MFSSNLKDRKVLREMRRLQLFMLPAALAIFGLIGGLYLLRLNTFDRAVATIETVWDQHSRNEKQIVTFAMLTFTRMAPDGQSHQCRHAFRIGLPSENYRVGEKLEIIPATGTCQRADILGRIDRAR